MRYFSNTIDRLISKEAKMSKKDSKNIDSNNEQASNPESVFLETDSKEYLEKVNFINVVIYFRI
jgi:hypothetical protein